MLIKCAGWVAQWYKGRCNLSLDWVEDIRIRASLSLLLATDMTGVDECNAGNSSVHDKIC